MLFVILGLAFRNNICNHGILQSKDTLGNFQAAGRWEERDLKLFKICSFEDGR